MFRSILLFSLILLMSGGAIAGIIKVPDQYATIQAGINAAFPGDTVLVADGTYYENIDFKGKAITVASHFFVDGDTTHINSTIIDGSKPTDPNKGSVVSFVSGEDTTSVICGFTITGGTGTLYSATQRAGGGIICYNSGCKAVANKMVNNTVTSPAAWGGGLATPLSGHSAYVVLKGNQIAHNTVTANSLRSLGGGLFLYCNAKLTANVISYNTCIGNASSLQSGGGGMYCYSPLPYSFEILVENNTITHNSVHSYCNVPGSGQPGAGGGVISRFNGRMIKNEISYNEIWDYSNLGSCCSPGVDVGDSPDSFLIEGNIIRGNAYKQGTGNCYGGGLQVYGTGLISVTNNLIEGNLATHGGGMSIYNTSTLEIVNNTIINNTAIDGGGLRINNATVYLMNSIIWGNQAPTNASIYLQSGTVKAAYCDIQGGWSGTENIKSDPLFVSGSAQLSETSPCLGAGIASFNFGTLTSNAPDTDILGNNRPSPSNSRPDIGAFEHERGFAKRPHFVEIPGDYPTIQAGINAAFPGDTVLVAAGTYYENIDFKGKAITVASHFLIDGDTTHVNTTIIDGSKPSDPNKGSVVSFVSGEDTTSVLCGFTITGGSGTYYAPYSAQAGGGVYCNNAGCKILNNRIIHNTVTGPSAYGGGLIAAPEQNSKFIILRDNQIEYNAVNGNSGAASGGGVELFCNAIVVNNSISHNESVANNSCYCAFSGGVDCETTISAFPHEIYLKNNKISHNSATNNNPNVPWGFAAVGGGISLFGFNGIVADNEICYNELWIAGDQHTNGAGIMVGSKANSLLIEGNIIRGNTTTKGYGVGGGALVYDASATFVNNIIDGNGATDGGGIAIHTSDSTKIINNTIINNMATSGGGIWTGLNSNSFVMNTIIWTNQAITGAGIHHHKGAIQVAYSDVQGGWSGIGNINLDPQLEAEGLSNSSPCIGEGIASHDFGGGMICSCPATDIAGNPRPDPSGSNPDMGAYESPLDTSTKVSELPLAEIPKAYFLAQNYPNPFNSSTVISYQLPVNSQVELSIYNLVGQKVVTLVSEKQSAGIHQLNWDARGLASGMYLYRLEAGSFRQSKKLILLR